MNLDDLLGRLEGVRGNGGSFVARCPAHADRNPSLSIKSTDDRLLLHCHAGCETQDVATALGLTIGQLFSTPLERIAPDDWLPCKHRKVADYPYHNANGTLLYGVTRCDQKCFAQWRPDPTKAYGRTWNLKGVPTGIPYRLPELLAADAWLNRWIVEGEKDADRLWSIGIPATCNSGGAGKWTDGHAQWLKGCDVAVVIDRDMPGRRHAEAVVATLMPLARSLMVLAPAVGKDVSDHLNAGLGIGKLVELGEPIPAPPLEVVHG